MPMPETGHGAETLRSRRRLSYMPLACDERGMIKPSKLLNFRRFRTCRDRVTLTPLDTVNSVYFVSTKPPESATP
jgi:hypothetical protein